MWLIGVEVEQETRAPPPKKNPGSAPAILLRMKMAGECLRYSINGEKSTKFILRNVLSSRIALRIY